MSFRNRLTVFFIVLVILPMIVVAAVGFVLASDSEQGKTDARLSEAQTSASGLFREKQDEAEKAARVIAQDRQLAQAIQAGQRGPIQARLNELASDNGIRRGVMTLQKAGRFETGRGDALAPARTRLLDAKGGTAGVLTLSAVGAEEYAQLTERVTGADVVVRSGNDMLAATLPDAGAERLPDQGEVEIGGRALRVTGFDGPGFSGGRVQVRLLAEPENGGLSGASHRGRRDPAGGADRRLRLRARRSRARCRPRSSACSTRRASSPPATSGSRCRPRATTSSPRSAPSST